MHLYEPTRLSWRDTSHLLSASSSSHSPLIPETSNRPRPPAIRSRRIRCVGITTQSELSLNVVQFNALESVSMRPSKTCRRTPSFRFRKYGNSYLLAASSYRYERKFQKGISRNFERKSKASKSRKAPNPFVFKNCTDNGVKELRLNFPYRKFEFQRQRAETCSIA